jgi:hypothetical protein
MGTSSLSPVRPAVQQPDLETENETPGVLSGGVSDQGTPTA